jgi:hypothetical protein
MLGFGISQRFEQPYRVNSASAPDDISHELVKIQPPRDAA